MSGNQNRAAQARARREAIYDELAPLLDRAKDALKAAELNPQDPLFTQRYVRAIELTGKAALTLEKVATGPRSAREPGDDVEQDVSKADRDDSPENLERIRAELLDDFDRIHAFVEQKDAGGGDDGGRIARDAGPPALAA